MKKLLRASLVIPTLVIISYSKFFSMFNIFPLLGGHASDTKRATNLKTFIRQDESKALMML